MIPIGLTAAAADAAIHINTFLLGACFFDSANRTKLIISNEEMDGIMKIVKSLEESSLLIKGVSETIQNEKKEQECGFHSI